MGKRGSDDRTSYKKGEAHKSREMKRLQQAGWYPQYWDRMGKKGIMPDDFNEYMLGTFRHLVPDQYQHKYDWELGPAKLKITTDDLGYFVSWRGAILHMIGVNLRHVRKWAAHGIHPELDTLFRVDGLQKIRQMYPWWVGLNSVMMHLDQVCDLRERVVSSGLFELVDEEVPLPAEDAITTTKGLEEGLE